MEQKNEYNCPICGNPIVVKNTKSSFKTRNDIVIKSRLVFLNEDGNILCRCQKCKNVVALPLHFNKSLREISKKEIIDI